MGKILDFIMTNGNWEEYQRIQLYKKVGDKLQNEKHKKNENSN